MIEKKNIKKLVEKNCKRNFVSYNQEATTPCRKNEY